MVLRVLRLEETVEVRHMHEDYEEEHAPLAAALQDVEDGVKDLARAMDAWPSLAAYALCKRYELCERSGLSVPLKLCLPCIRGLIRMYG